MVESMLGQSRHLEIVGGARDRTGLDSPPARTSFFAVGNLATWRIIGEGRRSEHDIEADEQGRSQRCRPPHLVRPNNGSRHRQSRQRFSVPDHVAQAVIQREVIFQHGIDKRRIVRHGESVIRHGRDLVGRRGCH